MADLYDGLVQGLNDAVSNGSVQVTQQESLAFVTPRKRASQNKTPWKKRSPLKAGHDSDMDVDGSSNEKEEEMHGASISRKEQDGTPPALPKQPEIPPSATKEQQDVAAPPVEVTGDNAVMSSAAGPTINNSPQEEVAAQPQLLANPSADPGASETSKEVTTPALPEPASGPSLPQATSENMPNTEESVSPPPVVASEQEDPIPFLPPSTEMPEPATNVAQPAPGVRTPPGSPSTDAPLTPLPEDYGSDEEPVPGGMCQSKRTAPNARDAKVGPPAKRAKKTVAAKKGKGSGRVKASTLCIPSAEPQEK